SGAVSGREPIVCAASVSAPVSASAPKRTRAAGARIELSSILQGFRCPPCEPPATSCTIEVPRPREIAVPLARPTLLLACLFALLTASLAPSRGSAQATCVDMMGDACLNALRSIRGDESVVDDIFQTSDGR